jgi:hypothetical protein
MFDALCEVRNIYQKNVVEIGVDVEQREEVEIPIQLVKHLYCMPAVVRFSKHVNDLSCSLYSMSTR